MCLVYTFRSDVSFILYYRSCKINVGTNFLKEKETFMFYKGTKLFVQLLFLDT